MEENTLERILKLAATDKGYVPEFYKVLLEASVFVLGASDLPGQGSVVLDTGTNVKLVSWLKPDGSSVIPFFSSLGVLQRSIDIHTGYLSLSSKVFFQMTLGSTLILNPKSDYGKEFLPQEISAILTDTLTSLPPTRVLENGGRVLIGQPEKYPAAMVTALTTLFSRHKNVKAAYLALMYNQAAETEPCLIVRIDVEGNFESLFREAGSVAQATWNTA